MGRLERTTPSLSESGLRLAAIAVGVVAYEWDPAEDRVLWTEGLTSVFGYPLNEVEPTRAWWSDRVHPDDRGQSAGLGYAALTQGRSSYSAEYRFRATDGQYRDVLDRGLVVTEAGGKARAVGGMVDITERKRLEEQLLHAQKMEAFGQLAGGIAHDFNNLLTAIAGYTELLLAQLDPADPARRDAEEVASVANRATSLTRQLLAFSRKQVLRPRVVDLKATLERMSEMLSPLIGEHIELVTRLAPDTGMIRIDPAQLEQVILNLCVNARDAMPDGGRLTIETRKLEPFSWVLLTIRDTGVGMDPETRAHIYEPFFTTKEAGKGTGLGLATVYGIVGQSGGDIDVETRPGRGTTFRIWFPRVDEEAEASAYEGGEADDSGAETILLVEDEEVVRSLASRALAERGYTVLEAASGQEALAIAAAHDGAIDILVTDVVMPGLNGRELYQQLKPLHPETFALFMSGYADDAILSGLLLDTGMAFVPKPFTPALLSNLASPYFYDIVRFLEEGLERAGLGMALSSAESTDFGPRRWLDSVRSRQGDGVILALASNLKVTQAVRELNVPIVLFDTWGESPPGVPAVGITEYPAALEAMQHLIALGHTRIGFIGGYEMAPCSRVRLSAYRASLGTAGLGVDPDLAREGNFLRDSGYEQTRALFELAGPPTAIVVASDEQALGCYQAAYELGRRIPDDLSIVGFDDLDFASGLAPPLTTVRQPFAEMSALTVRMLLRLLAAEQLEESRVEVPARLVIRGSTGTPRS